MKVKCNANLGKSLSPNALKVVGFISTNFQLEIGDTYNVYSISLYKGILNYLTIDRWNTYPFWFPAELFSIENPSVPQNWYFRFNNPPTRGGLEALWGYWDMVHDPNHYDNLIERESNALKVFFEEKTVIDFWWAK